MAAKTAKKRKMMVNVEETVHECLRQASFTMRVSMSRIVNEAIKNHLRKVSRATQRDQAET